VEIVLNWKRVRVGRHRALAMTGTLRLPELRAQIAFRGSDGKGSGNGHANGHGLSAEHRAVATIIPPRFTMVIPLQYLSMPGQDERDVWALTPAPDREPPWMEHYAGELEGDPLTFDQYVPVDVTLDITFAPEECQNGRGVSMDVAGELRFERPTHMRLLFRDPKQSTAPPSESESDEAVLVVAGSRVPIPHQTVSSVAGANQSMTVRVVEADGRIVCLEQPLAGPTRIAS
jgi:hypothetical protein